MNYTKKNLEKIVPNQLENLNAQGEYIILIKEENELLLKCNHKLISELSDKLKKPKPYPIKGKSKS